MKICTKCNKQKLVSEFHTNGKYFDGSIKYRTDCKECVKKRKKKYYLKNKEHIIFKANEWQQNNPERTKEIHRLKQRRRNKTISGKLNSFMSFGIYHSLFRNKKGNSWLDYVDYTKHDLKLHLETLFEPGMDWNNYGNNGWEIDHIIPKSSFNIINSECKDFKMCWFLLNLQPMWASENRSKADQLYDGSRGRNRKIT